MTMHVHIKPSSNDRVERVDDNHFEIYVSAPAKEGKANLASIKLLAKHLDIAPSRIEIVKGHTSRNKVFEIN